MHDYKNDMNIPEESRKGMDLNKIEEAVRMILEGIGEDPDREGLQETPYRVAKMYAEVFSGLHRDINKDLKVFHEPGNDEMILIGDIPFYSMCEHHLLPFYGKCAIGYISQGKVLGVSKLARIVDMFSRRLQIQERLTEEIADAVMAETGAEGVGVVIRAKHLCMMMRGVEKQNSEMTTSAVLGTFRTDEKVRQEFLSLIGG